jgi:predicted NAD-dependent protein-ADP-ribosyltransferase YbiA (DUF1768 family)
MNVEDCFYEIEDAKKWNETSHWNGENLLGFILTILRSEY